MAEIAQTFSIDPYAAERAKIARQQKFAELLESQSLQPNEKFSYAGIEAPISAASGLAKALQAGMSGYLQGDAARKEDAANIRQETDSNAANEAFIRGMTSTPEDPGTRGMSPATEEDVASRALSISQGSTARPLTLGEPVDVLGGLGARGTEGTPGTPAIPGSYDRVIKELAGLTGNPYAGRLSQQLMMRKIEQNTALQQAAAEREAQFTNAVRLKQTPGAGGDTRTAEQKNYAAAVEAGEKRSFPVWLNDMRQIAAVATYQGAVPMPPPGGLGSGGGSPPQGAAGGPAAPANSPPPVSLPGPAQAFGAGLPPRPAQAQQRDEEARASVELRESREKLPEASRVAADAKRFLELMRVQPTGGWYRNLPGAGAIEAAFDPETEEMRAITDRLTPLMRQGLPGSATENDVRMFRGGTVGTNKNPQTNQNIGQGMVVAAQNLSDQQDFKEAYVAQHKTLQGANEAWKSYLDANPIFDPKSSVESPTLNLNRASWRSHFSPGGRPPAAPIAPPAEDRVEIPPLPPGARLITPGGG